MKYGNLLTRYNNGKIILPSMLEELTDDQLREFQRTVELSVAEIKSQLDPARARAATTGEYADRDWYQRANKARSMRGLLIRHIQAELGNRRRRQAEINRSTSLAKDKNASRLWNQCLMRALDIVLTLEQRQAVLEKARELKGFEEESVLELVAK